MLKYKFNCALKFFRKLREVAPGVWYNDSGPMERPRPGHVSRAITH
jgi:hypothetical protein